MLLSARVKKAEATKVGSIKECIVNKHGEIICYNAMLDNVAVLPESKFNLIRASVLLHSGWALKGDKHSMKLIKGSIMLEFNIKVATKCSALCCMKFEHYLNNEINNATFDSKKMRFCDELETTTVTKALPYEKLDHPLGHMGKNIIIEIEKHLKYNVTRQNKLLHEDCTVAKAQRKKNAKD